MIIFNFIPTMSLVYTKIYLLIIHLYMEKYTSDINTEVVKYTKTDNLLSFD